VRQYVDIFDNKLGNKIVLRYYQIPQSRQGGTFALLQQAAGEFKYKIYIYYSLPACCGMIVAYFDGNH
jgi:hypothetical protein